MVDPGRQGGVGDGPSLERAEVAGGFMPPTEALSASPPSTWTAPPSASLTTAARSAVGT